MSREYKIKQIFAHIGNVRKLNDVLLDVVYYLIMGMEE